MERVCGTCKHWVPVNGVLRLSKVERHDKETRGYCDIALESFIRSANSSPESFVDYDAANYRGMACHPNVGLLYIPRTTQPAPTLNSK